MRYVLAGVSLVAALILFGFGIAQRTIWAPPTSVAEQIDEQVETPVLVLDGSFLNLHEGNQSIRAESDGELTAVVGRTIDVLGWIGPASYTIVSASGDADDPISVEVVQGEDSVPAIAGSDLWIEEVSGEDAVSFVRSLPPDVSVAFVSDGEAPPGIAEVRWPISSSTPLFGPLITAGLVMLGIALLLLFAGLRGSRKKRGPQRRPNQGLASRRSERRGRRALPAAEPAAIGATTTAVVAEAESDDEVVEAELVEHDGAADSETPDDDSGGPDDDPTDGPDDDDSTTTGDPDTVVDDSANATHDEPGRTSMTARTTTGRRRLRWLAIPVLVGVALTGCSAEYWPSAESSEAPAETPNATDEPESFEDTLPAPAVTVRQFERILDDTRAVLAEAEAALSAEIASERIGGDVLEGLTANYQARGANADIPAFLQIPDGRTELLLPQQSDVWPRQVLAVIGWEDTSMVQWALVFEQASARDNYLLVSAVQLIPESSIPEVAGVEVGAASLPSDTPLLDVPPAELAAAYADVAFVGAESEFAEVFSTLEDPLLAQVGQEAKAALQANPDNSLITISWTQTPAEEPSLILSTTDGGALVVTSYSEVTTAVPNTEGATVGPSGEVGIALLGSERSETGIATTRDYQLLFYVPPSGSLQQVELLGYWDAVLAVANV